MNRFLSFFAALLARVRKAAARVSQTTLAGAALFFATLSWALDPPRMDMPFYRGSASHLVAVALVAALGIRAYRASRREKTYQQLAESRGLALINTSAELAQANQAEREAHAARRHAERGYRAIFDNASEGIFQTSPEGQYLTANPALARLYGYDTPDHLMASLTNIAGQLYVDPTRRAAFREELLTHDRVTDFVSEIRRRDGTTLWISENARAVRNDAGEILYYEGTVADITARREAENAIRTALVEAEQASRAKVAFLAAMSHELRTPLNAVIGFAEILQDERLGPIGVEKYREFAGEIHDNGKKLLQRINDILDLTRIEGGGATLDLEEVALGGVLAQACELAQAQYALDNANAQRAVGLDVPEGLPMLFADKRRLRQIFKNLIDNALKFTPDNGTVTVGAQMRADGGMEVVVQDTGIGMPPERIPIALEPFKQLDSALARRFEGIGLGLPLARALTVLHGGQLRIKSAPAQGTTVTLTFPPAMVCTQDKDARAAQCA